MKSHRPFLLRLLLIYAVTATSGILLFHGPNYSKAYLEKHGIEHKRYHHIVKNPEYQRYRERPGLNPLDAALQKEADFAIEYESGDAYRAEQRRIMAYVLWFKFLNIGIVAALAFHFLRRPLLAYLDDRIATIRDEHDTVEHAFLAARARLADAQKEFDRLPVKEQEIRDRIDHLLDRNLAEINEQTEFAKEQIAHDIDNRKIAEEHAAVNALKRELVETALRQLEERYRKEATVERLSGNVDQFTTLMEFLA